MYVCIMYVGLCIYACNVYVLVCVFVFMYICMYEFMQACMWVYKLCIHVCMHVSEYGCTNALALEQHAY